MLKKLDMATISLKNKVRKFFSEEKGDTNFISILIILGIVILLAGVFLGFKDAIVTKVSDIVDNLKFS